MESLLELLKEQLISQERRHKEQMEALIAAIGKPQVAGQSSSTALTTPNFIPFDSTS